MTRYPFVASENVSGHAAGWSDGRNVWIDARGAAANPDTRKYAAELVALGPDVVLASTTVDVSWNEAWNFTEQRRHFRFEGEKAHP